MRTQNQSASVQRKSAIVAGWNIASIRTVTGRKRDERGRADREPVATGPELARDPPDEQHGPEQEEHVHRHPGPVRVVDAHTEFADEPIGRPGDGVVAGRRVVLAGAVRQLAARHEPVGVGLMVKRVVAEPGRVVNDVPRAEDDDESADRRERAVTREGFQPPVSPL